jgi:hypothetical protein
MIEALLLLLFALQHAPITIGARRLVLACMAAVLF